MGKKSRGIAFSDLESFIHRHRLTPQVFNRVYEYLASNKLKNCKICDLIRQTKRKLGLMKSKSQRCGASANQLIIKILHDLSR